MHWLIGLPESIPWLTAHPHCHGLISSVMGLVVGGGAVWLIRVVGNWAFQREAMGEGDVWLMMMIGSYIGWQPSLVVFFFIAPIAALIVTVTTWITRTLRFNREIPFGPYLSIATMIVLLGWNPIFSSLQPFFSRGPFLFFVLVMMVVCLAPFMYLMRFLRNKLGFGDEMLVEEWTSGDQLAFYANKEERQDRSSMTQSNWPGIASGQGRTHSDRWRSGN
jgi:leader peptidase (prepilin peptidase)/N-methyltransferase